MLCFSRQGERCKRGNRTPSVRPFRQPTLLYLRFASLARGAMQAPLSPTCGRPAPPVRPALCFGQPGERCISNRISRYKRKTRIYRIDLSRVGRCVRPQSTYISVEWSLLSKGLRGGKSRRLRVVSLLRRMIASEDAKNPLQVCKQKGIQGYGLAISACKEGMK